MFRAWACALLSCIQLSFFKSKLGLSIACVFYTAIYNPTVELQVQVWVQVRVWATRTSYKYTYELQVQVWAASMSYEYKYELEQNREGCPVSIHAIGTKKSPYSLYTAVVLV